MQIANKPDSGLSEGVNAGYIAAGDEVRTRAPQLGKLSRAFFSENVTPRISEKK